MTVFPTVRFLDRSTPPHISTLILLAGLQALALSIFLPSLATMAAEFGADYAVMQLSVSAYLAATAVLQIVVGPIADRFGRRPVVLGALGVFLIATLGTLLAPTAGLFLLFRMIQAVVATGMAMSRAIVRDMYPAEQAASRIGYVTLGVALIPLLGPMIGGALAEAFGWRSTLVALLVMGSVVLALCWRDQGETAPGGGSSFREQLRTYPELLSSPRFWGYALCAAFGSGAFFALLGGTSFVAGEIFGLSPLWAGIALGAPAVGYALGNYLSGRYAATVGIDRLALAGNSVTASGMAVSLLCTLLGFSSPWLFFGFCCFVGLGNGMMLPGATAGSLSVRPQLAGTASGLGGAIMIGGGAALSALAGASLTVETGTLPLQAIMLGTALCGCVAILLVIRRNRRLGALG